MVLLEKLWDDVIAGPRPERGLGELRVKDPSAKPLAFSQEDGQGESGDGKPYKRSLSTPATRTTPQTPVVPAKKADVWRSVFHPGSNINMKSIGADFFDRPQPNSPTIYDWMYCGETRSKHR